MHFFRVTAGHVMHVAFSATARSSRCFESKGLPAKQCGLRRSQIVDFGNFAQSKTMKGIIEMNCYDLDPSRARQLSSGIPLKGIDGVDLGRRVVVPFSGVCLSDMPRHLSQMTFEGRLIEADLLCGEIRPSHPTSINTLVRLKIETGTCPLESLFMGDGGIKVGSVGSNQTIQHVVGSEEYQYLLGRPTLNVSILLSLMPNSAVPLQWTTKQVETRWFRRKERLVDHLAGLSLENGKPVFVQHY
jgi:hypothetical protein